MKVHFHIGEIVSDAPGLSRRDLTAALEAEIKARIAAYGPQAFGPAGARAHAEAEISPSKQGLPVRVAAAAVKAVQG